MILLFVLEMHHQAGIYRGLGGGMRLQSRILLR